jgi:CO/xanthine dehydrogenase FAD-binding subunit
MRFNYLEARTIEEAISLLTQNKGKIKVLAGGTDLLLQIRNKKIRSDYVVDITSIPNLGYIHYDETTGLKIGALTTIRALETSLELINNYPIIPQAARQLGSVAIRNVATVGGNLCNASPSAETAQVLVALSAKAKIFGPSGERTVLLEDFFTGVNTTVLKMGELLIEIQVPVMPLDTKGIYLKHSMRGTIDLAIVNFAVIMTQSTEDPTFCKDIRIVMGAVARTPMRARKAEEVMRGKRINEDLIQTVAQVASEEATPRSESIRGSVEYKKEMVKVFIRRLIGEIVSTKG